MTLSKFDLKTRKLDKLAENIGSFDLSSNGEKMLLRVGLPRGGAPAAPAAAPQYVIVPANAALKPGEGALRLANAEVESIRWPSGSRCITKSGASSAASSMTPVCTA